MKVRTLMLANAAVLAICATAFLAPSASAGEGWYIGLGAGWDQIKNPVVYGGGLDGELHTRDAPVFAGTLGYKFSHLPVRLEAETAWDSHDTSSYAQGGHAFAGSGHAEVRSAMGNMLYDVHVMPRLKVSLGGGAGIGDDRIKFIEAGGPGEFSTGMRTGFMWQAIGGATFDVSRDFDLFVEYHYRNLHNGNNNPAVPYTPHALIENVVMAGFRWYPWTPAEQVAYQAPPPMPPAPPPPPPPPPAPVKTFIVFFDFNKSDLTSEAQTVVSEAVRTATQTNAVRILVTGHTDTVGSDGYNQALSMRRAGTVKDEMIREGMKADEISTVGKSFHDPLVQTGPGVREPQNRRAVIDLGG